MNTKPKDGLPRVGISEAEETRRGLMIVELLSLRLNFEGRYNTTGGDKTALGLYRTMERIVLDGE